MASSTIAGTAAGSRKTGLLAEWHHPAFREKHPNSDSAKEGLGTGETGVLIGRACRMSGQAGEMDAAGFQMKSFRVVFRLRLVAGGIPYRRRMLPPSDRRRNGRDWPALRQPDRIPNRSSLWRKADDEGLHLGREWGAGLVKRARSLEPSNFTSDEASVPRKGWYRVWRHKPACLRAVRPEPFAEFQRGWIVEDRKGECGPCGPCYLPDFCGV
jgi:hypothetical protein